MRIRLTTIAILIAATVAISATPAAGERSCGTAREGGNGQTVRVSIYRGRLSCAEARKAIRNVKAGRGVERHVGSGGSFAEKSWAFPGGWVCKWGTGGFDCVRGGSGPLRSLNPRDGVDATYIQ